MNFNIERKIWNVCVWVSWPKGVCTRPPAGERPDLGWSSRCRGSPWPPAACVSQGSAWAAGMQPPWPLRPPGRSRTAATAQTAAEETSCQSTVSDIPPHGFSSSSSPMTSTTLHPDHREPVIPLKGRGVDIKHTDHMDISNRVLLWGI